MANESVLKIETHTPIPFTCADATGIEKGAVCKMTDNMTASLSDGDGDIVAGVVHSEKIASDGNTQVGIYRGGIFLGTAEGTITVGDSLITGASTGAANSIMTAGVNAENILGVALESATDGNQFLYELKPMAVNLA